MQVNKINSNTTNLNFRSKIVMKPEVMKCMLSLDRSEYVGLFDFTYSPLQQRKILYNILKHIRKDKVHKVVEIDGGWSGAMCKDHVLMKTDGELQERWACFRRYKNKPSSSDYISHLLSFVCSTYPNKDFAKNIHEPINVICLKKILSITKNPQRIERLNKKINESANNEYEKLEQKIKELINEDTSKQSIWNWLKMFKSSSSF